MLDRKAERLDLCSLWRGNQRRRENVPMRHILYYRDVASRSARRAHFHVSVFADFRLLVFPMTHPVKLSITYNLSWEQGAEREASPTACIIDSQSGDPHGFNAGKLTKARRKNN
jgi:hypothetical protein